jgi:hypothetical protein
MPASMPDDGAPRCPAICATLSVPSVCAVVFLIVVGRRVMSGRRSSCGGMPVAAACRSCLSLPVAACRCLSLPVAACRSTASGPASGSPPQGCPP